MIAVVTIGDVSVVGAGAVVDLYSLSELDTFTSAILSRAASAAASF